MQSIQDRLYPDLTCFGCGPRNAEGLQLRSFPADEGAVTAVFSPWPAHDNGLGYLNGGIIATVLDCHSAAAVMYEADRRGWRAVGDALLPFVTAGLDVQYRRPSPLHGPVQLHAVVTDASEAQITVRAELASAGRTCAAAIAVWKRWRPR